jgi:hypothetical protein
MCPVNAEDRKWANFDMLELLESRFTQEQVQKLPDAYQDNWMTQENRKHIANLGCYVVRGPFWYRNFMKDGQGTWIMEELDENPAIQYCRSQRAALQRKRICHDFFLIANHSSR